jgi:hypothetical protein
LHPLSNSLVVVVRLVHLRMLWLPADRILGFFYAVGRQVKF